ncbi:DUF6491 family protein [Colwelliaceae bacterium 6441]
MMKLLLSLLLSLLLFSACSNNSSASLKEKSLAFIDYIKVNEIESINKISSFKFHGWNSLTDEFLIISSSPKQQYLLELRSYCPGLRWAHAIILNRLTNSTLHANYDTIATNEYPEVTCRIKAIYPLNKQQVVEISAINKDDQQKEKSHQ